MTLPRVGITLGDPGGIGPEVIVKAFSRKKILPPARYVVFGTASVLEDAARALGLERFWAPESGEPRPGLPEAELVEVGGEGRAASFRYFEEAVSTARRGDLQAIVTAPISKQAWLEAGIPFRGHTDYLERFYPDAVMSFWSRRLNVALLSHHLPLAEAVRLVTAENMARFFRSLKRSLDLIHPKDIEFLVAGLNPHAGEGGRMGVEETTVIGPAIEQARREGMPVRGPFPPDTVFRLAIGHPEKVVIALYHDQGLIPFKLEAFGHGVNLTLGLPFIRTSPDHGTAFDIAGKNAADPRSMIEAIRLAVRLAPSA